jgi:multiple sugar transport system permease protein
MATTSATASSTRVVEGYGLRTRIRDFLHDVKRNRVSYFFMAPYMIVFTLFVILPVFAGIYLSFTYFNVLQPPRWIGLDNYRLLFLEDEVFLTAIKNTIKYAVVTGPIGYVLAFVVAWTINQMRLRIAFTLAYYAPSLTTGVAIAMIWQVFFWGGRRGYLNYLLVDKLGILSEPIFWLQDVRTMLPCIMVVQLWMSLGAGFLAHIAGLKNIPDELYEAGRIDGISNVWQEIWCITLPMMRPQLLFAAIMSVTGSLKAGGLTSALAGFPSPLYAAHTILNHLDDYAFIRFEMGYAAAISVVLFAMMILLSRVFFKIFQTRDELD